VRATGYELRDTIGVLAAALDEETFSGGPIPRSIPYLTAGVDLDTYQAALGVLAQIGLVSLTPDTIDRGPHFSTLAPQIAKAMAAHREANRG
jgi:hypothetical protein